jgi:hypothetical protein
MAPNLISVCCILLFTYFVLDGAETFPHELGVALRVATIFLSVVSNLASVGSKISIEKDWVVVIANDDKERLTKINSIFRTIDLVGRKLLKLVRFVIVSLFNLKLKFNAKITTKNLSFNEWRLKYSEIIYKSNQFLIFQSDLSVGRASLNR